MHLKILISETVSALGNKILNFETEALAKWYVIFEFLREQ
jgi:hypothetical protein